MAAIANVSDIRISNGGTVYLIAELLTTAVTVAVAPLATVLWVPPLTAVLTAVPTTAVAVLPPALEAGSVPITLVECVTMIG